MRGLLINSYDQKVVDLDIPNETEEFNQRLKTALCCNTIIDTISSDNSILIFIDQESLTNQEHYAFVLPMLPFPLFGNAVLLGRNLVTGEREQLQDHKRLSTDSIVFLSLKSFDVELSKPEIETAFYEYRSEKQLSGYLKGTDDDISEIPQWQKEAVRNTLQQLQQNPASFHKWDIIKEKYRR